MRLRENHLGQFSNVPCPKKAGQRAAVSPNLKGQWLLAVLCVVAIPCFNGCSKRTPSLPEVRIDLERASQVALGADALKSLGSQANALREIPSLSPRLTHAESARLPHVTAPPVSNLIKQRRAEAEKAVQQQRQTALESLIQAGAAQMQAQIALWRQELLQAVDYSQFEDEWYRLWREAFIRSANRRYTLLFEQSRYRPTAPEFARWQSELDKENQLWLKEQSDLLKALERQRKRAMEEVDVLLNQRKQAFMEQATRDANNWLSQQPKLTRLIEEDNFPARELKPLSMQFQPPKVPKSISFQHEIEPIQSAWKKASRAQMKQMAEEWAAKKGYKLTQDPRASDKTEEFLNDYARLSTR